MKKNITTFLIIMVGILLAQLAEAAVLRWKGPSSTPPNGNIAAPITVLGVDQVKKGTLGLEKLGVFGNAYVIKGSYAVGNVPASVRFGVNGDVGAKRYCDENGNNCSSMSGIQSGYLNGCRTVVSPVNGTWSEAHCEAGEIRTGGGCRSHGGAYQAHVYPIDNQGQGCASGATGTYTEAFAICCPTAINAVLKPSDKISDTSSCIDPSTWTWRSGCVAK